MGIAEDDIKLTATCYFRPGIHTHTHSRRCEVTEQWALTEIIETFRLDGQAIVQCPNISGEGGCDYVKSHKDYQANLVL